MNRDVWKALPLALLILSLRLGALAQTSDPLILSKDAMGPITRVSLSLTLQSNAACDQTQDLIPNGSRLVANGFTMVINDKGLGTFRGSAKIVTSEGRPILEGFLRGIVGLTSCRSQGKDCRARAHLEGLLEGFRLFSAPSADAEPGVEAFVEVAPADTASSPGTDLILPARNPVTILTLIFSADEIQEIAGPLPIYRARLDGLVMPPPVAPRVRIAPDRLSYGVNDPIEATIINGSDHAIRTFDLRSYCTIVQLQRQEGNEWVQVAPCPLRRPSLPVTINAGETKQVLLPPEANAWAQKEPGVYRLALTFTNLDKEGKPEGDAVTITSALFRVVASPTDEGVTVTPDRNIYSVEDRIVVKVSNNTDSSIQTADHRSYCSILSLQRQTGDQWINVAPCLLRSPTRLITIGARQSVSVMLPPEPARPLHELGTYRVEFSFVFLDSKGQPVGRPVVLFSQPFSVVALGNSALRRGSNRTLERQ